MNLLGRLHHRGLVVLLLIALLVLALLARGCTFTGGRVSGRVLDADSGQPIDHAIVVALWRGSVSSLVDSQSVCFHVETAVSDTQGQYSTPRWWQRPKPWPMLGSTTVLDAYKPGYESIHIHTKDAEAHPEDVYMKRFSGTESARFEYVYGRVFSGMSFVNAGASQRNLFELHRQAIQEAKALARTESEIRQIEGMRIVAANDWLTATPDYADTFDRALQTLPANVRRELE